MAISLRSIISEQQARKFQEDDDGKYARTTAREDAEYEAMLAQVLAASIADVPEDVLEAIRAMDSSEKDVDGGVTVITGKDIESDGVPPSETGPVATSDVDPDFAIALALQEEEDRALAKSQGSSRIGGGPSRYDGDYHSRLRQDERYHAGKEDFAVSSADWAGKPKGKQPKGTAPTKHDPVICGRQNAKYLERRYGDEMGTLAAGQKIDNPTFNSLRTFLGRRRGKRPIDVSHVGDAESENVLRRLKACGDITSYTFLSYGSDATLYRVAGWRAPSRVASSVAVASSTPGSDNDSDDADYVMVSGTPEDVKSVDTCTTTRSVPTATRLSDVIVKVFRLGVDEYTARVEALEGDHKLKREKFSRQYAKKLAKHCAQVEFDNLTALFAAKVPVPQPLYSSGNVLVLSGVITESGKPALPLNSTHLSPAELKSAYTQSLQILNDACTKAQIAVGSFSEADLLWKDGSVVLIDVPHCLKMSEAEDEVALDVVTEGVYNITKYFEDMDVDVLPYHVVMGVITSPLVKDTEEVEGAKVSPFVQRLRQLLRERKGG